MPLFSLPARYLHSSNMRTVGLGSLQKRDMLNRPTRLRGVEQVFEHPTIRFHECRVIPTFD